MIYVVIDALFAVLWLMTGIYTIRHQPITSISYGCVVVMIVVIYALRSIKGLIEYKAANKKIT